MRAGRKATGRSSEKLKEDSKFDRTPTKLQGSRAKKNQQRPSDIQFANIVEKMQEGFVAFDRQLNYTYINQRGSELLQRKPEDLIGKNYRDEYPHDKEPSFGEAYLRALENQTPITLDDYYAPRDRWFENRIYPSEAGLSIFFNEITERKQAEETLQKINERLLATYQHAPVGIVECSPDEKYINVNEEFCRIVGYDKQELLTLSIKDVTYSKDAPHDIALHQKLIAGKIPFYKLEQRYIRKDGEIVWTELTRSVVCDAHGKAMYTIGVVLDINQWKKTETEIRNNSRLPDENPNPVMRMTAEGEVIYANAPATHLLKFWKQESDQTLPAELRQHVAKVFASGVDEQIEIEEQGKTFACTLVSIREAGYINFYSKDITERKHIEEKLRVSEERLRLATEAAGIFAWELDLETQVYAVADNFAEVLGFSADVLPKTLPQALQALSSEEDIEIFTETLNKAIKNRTDLRNLQYRITNPETGQVIWLEVNAKNIYDKDGNPRRMLGMAQNITESKQTEAYIRYLNTELKARLDEMNTLMDILPVGIWIGNADCSVITGNPAAYQMLGLTPGSNVSATNADSDLPSEVRIFVKGIEVPPEDAPMQQVARSGKPFYNFEHELLFADGTLKGIYGSVVPLFNEQDAVRKIIASYMDFTERKEAERRLMLLTHITELLRKFEDPNDLLYVISRAVGEHLRVKRCLFNEIDLENDVELVHRDYCQGVPSVAGTHKISTYSSITATQIAAGKTIVNTDSKLDVRTAPDYERAYAPNGERAYVAVPLLREKRWVASLWVSDDTPRQWSKEEVSLLESIAERTWNALENLRINESLRLSEERFAKFMQYLPGLAWIKDAQGRYVYANDAAEKAFSTPRENLYGKTDHEVFAPEVAAQFQRNDERVFLDGTGVQVIETLEQADGILHYSLVNKFPIPSPDDGMTLIGGTAFDITERRQAEEALRRSEERYRSLFDLVPVAVYTCDADGLIQEFNTHAVELWGREPRVNDPGERFCGSFKLYYADGGFMTNEESPMARILSGETLERSELEIIAQRPDGILRSVIVTALPIKNERGEIMESINCLYDITERKHAEAGLRRLNRELESRVESRTVQLQQANQSLEESRKRLQMLSQRLVEVQEEERHAIARELHDRVGQSLAALSLNLTIIGNQLLTQADEQVKTRLLDSTHLVKEVIALVRNVMANLRPTVLDDYGLEVALQAYLEELKVRYSIRILFEKTNPPLPRLSASVEMTILRIAQEALLNIVRHAHADQAALSFQVEDETIRLTIQDNGMGIQSSPGEKRRGSHGLMIMRERAEAVGGNLRISSQPGQGTEIEISIPFQERTPKEPH